MKITKVSHIGIAVNNIDEAIKLYTEVLGLKVNRVEDLADRKVKIATIQVGDIELELLQSTSPDGNIARFIKNKGEGLHHVALQVTDIQESLDTLTRKGIALLDAKPSKGAGNNDIAFVDPKGTKILLELVEPRK